MIRTLAAALMAAAIAASPAAAHGDGGSRGFRSRVVAVQPRMAGLLVEVRDSDDRLFLQNDTGRTIEVAGYEGEPYLRFSDDAVFRNRRSPATYLNEERYGGVPVPDDASPKARPEWERVSGDPSWEWHDYRIHWMSQVDPPGVRREPDRAQCVFDWVVAGRVGDERLSIRGRLDYRPTSSSGPRPWHYATLLGVVLLGTAATAWRFRRNLRIRS